MENEEYRYCLKELLKRKTYPYSMANEEYAIEFYERLKKDYPEARLYIYGISQFICLDDRARKRLAKKAGQWIKEEEDRLEALKKFKMQVEGL